MSLVWNQQISHFAIHPIHKQKQMKAKKNHKTDRSDEEIINEIRKNSKRKISPIWKVG